MYKKVLDKTYSIPIRTLQKAQIDFSSARRNENGLLLANAIKFYSDGTQEPSKIELIEVIE